MFLTLDSTFLLFSSLHFFIHLFLSFLSLSSTLFHFFLTLLPSLPSNLIISSLSYLCISLSPTSRRLYSLSFSFFSHPPLISYLIHLTWSEEYSKPSPTKSNPSYRYSLPPLELTLPESTEEGRLTGERGEESRVEEKRVEKIRMNRRLWFSVCRWE